MRQVERHWIKEGGELYSICDDLTLKAKNLYNAGLYQVRQSIFNRSNSKEENKPPVLSWVELVSQFRKEKQLDMLALPSKVATNILKLVGPSISSYYQLMKRYHDSTNSSIVHKPRLPKYLHKTKGLASLGKVLDRSLVLFHTRSLTGLGTQSNLDLVVQYM